MNPVNEARKYIGFPFRHMGRGPRYFDCAGLVLAAFRDAGIIFKDHPTRYGREPHKDGLRQVVMDNLGPPASLPLQVGDIALIKFSEEPHHIALIGDYIHGGLSLIHADGTKKKVVEHVLNKAWEEKIIEVYRWNFN